MDTKTCEALEGSIKKWELILAGEGRDEGYRNCPLCQMFNTPELNASRTGPACEGCPVREETGEGGCRNTPYEKWDELCASLRTDWIDPAITPVFRRELEKCAMAELDFLKGLLP